jgi:pimeloyl-ACP methyl ester carboxylesterase
MKRLLVLVSLALAALEIAAAQTTPGVTNATAIRYGANPAAGGTFTHDGISLYYEVYGFGDPLLLVHGNGGSIGSLTAQIAYFREHYRVIAMDSRDHGRSGDSPGNLTYEKMTDDLAALLDHLNTGPVYVLGWSDGANQALMLALRHPAKVRKAAAMAANLNSSEDAIRPEFIALVKSMVASAPAADEDTPAGRRRLKVRTMLLDQPEIPLESLEAITAPTLVMAGDHDIIRDEHTVAIFQHIPNSQLAIFPNATHMVPYDDPALFNATVDRFFRAPFVRRNRIDDTLKSIEKMHAAQEAQTH